jgi:hypothetical protein
LLFYKWFDAALRWSGYVELFKWGGEEGGDERRGVQDDLKYRHQGIRRVI